MSQKEIARVLGVSEAAVSNWARQGAPVAAGAEAVATWRAHNKRVHISATARPTTPTASAAEPQSAPPMTAPGHPPDLGHERALLAREQRINIEIKNAVLRGEYAPISLLAEVLAAASQAVAERFDHLPGRVRKACPTLPTTALDVVMRTIAEARNEWVSQTVALVSSQIVSPEDADDDGEPEGPTDAS